MKHSRGIVPEDLYGFRFLHNPRFSTNREELLFVATRPNRVENAYSSEVWRYVFSTKAASRVFKPKTPITALECSPDGSKLLYMTSTKAKKGRASEIWVYDLTTSTSRRLISLRVSRIAEPKWSADSKHVYFIADIDEESVNQPRASFKFITRMNYRYDGVGVYGDTYTHIFRVGLDGTLERLTSGAFDVQTMCVAPDSETLFFAANTEQDADFRVDTQIYSFMLMTGQAEKIFSNRGAISAMSVSPNGTSLAFVGDDYRYRFNTPAELWLLDLHVNQAKNLTSALDRPLFNAMIGDSSFDGFTFPPSWSPDSSRIFFTATNNGSCNVYSVIPESGKIIRLTPEKQVVTSLTVYDEERIAYIANDPTHLGEIYLYDHGKILQITHINGPLLSNLRLSYPIEFSFKARDGEEVRGFFYPPIGANPPYPCVVRIHGGGSAEGYYFSQETQSLCSLGFSVLTCNFRGTKGYGSASMSTLTGHYMEQDYTDIVDMVDHAAKMGWVNPSKICVTGGSYGGYLTNWLISHEKIFRAAVTDRSVVNLYSFYGTSDDYRLIEEDVIQALPWERPEKYFEKSPITYVKNIDTPLLIIHSEEDYRCRIEQAEQLFAFLRRMGKPVAFARFSGESHSLSRTGKPENKLMRLKLILWWFTSHIDGVDKVPKPF